MQYLFEELDCDLGWRMAKRSVVRFAVCVFLFLLFAFILKEEWNECRPITGEYNDYISIQGAVVQDDIRNVENALDKLPEWIVNQHYENGGNIFLKSEEFPNEDNGELGDNERVLGTYNYKTKNITVLKDCDVVERTLFHEFGHYLDDYFSITNTEEFKEIFENEKEFYEAKVDGNDYHISGEKEYFAGAFSLYFSGDRRLKKYCPDTYQHIKKYVEGSIS